MNGCVGYDVKTTAGYRRGDEEVYLGVDVLKLEKNLRGFSKDK